MATGQWSRAAAVQPQRPGPATARAARPRRRAAERVRGAADPWPQQLVQHSSAGGCLHIHWTAGGHRRHNVGSFWLQRPRPPLRFRLLCCCSTHLLGRKMRLVGRSMFGIPWFDDIMRFAFAFRAVLGRSSCTLHVLVASHYDRYQKSVSTKSRARSRRIFLSGQHWRSRAALFRI